MSDITELPDDIDIKVRVPRFERTDGVEPQHPPTTPEGWYALRTYDRDKLEEMGLRPWSPDEDPPLMMFPKEWYRNIPEGYEVENILGDVEEFSQETHSRDHREGVLAYGVRPRPEVDGVIQCRGCGQTREHAAVIQVNEGDPWADFDVKECDCGAETARYRDGRGDPTI